MLRVFGFLPFVALLVMPLRAWAGCGDFPNLPLGTFPPYNPTVLVQTYNCIRATYDPSKRLDFTPLETAGIQTLLYSSGGLPPALRVQILNDYGFWIYKYGEVNEWPQDVLQIVVQLAPDRAVAWLNLGDVYAADAKDESQFHGPGDDILAKAEIPSLINQAVDAYHHYVKLTPNPTQRVKDFLAQHPYNAAYENVCRYVATAANSGALQKLFIPDGTPVDLLGDGTRYYVYTTYQGTMDIPTISAFTAPQANPYDDSVQQNAARVNFDPLEQIYGIQGAEEGVNPGDDLKLFLYHGHYYVLQMTRSQANDATYQYGHPGRYNADPPMALIQVVQPNQGIICHVSPIITPAIALGQGNPLCDHFLKGVNFPQPRQDSSLAGDNILLVPNPGGDDFHMLTGTATADLENNGHTMLVGFYKLDSGAGAGCDQSGIRLYDPIKKTESASKLNGAIAEIPLGCRNDTEFLITWQGKTYIETDHGSDTLPGEAQGMGIYEARNEQIRPVCLIRNQFTYSAN